MYRKIQTPTTSIKRNNSVQGETIEMKCRRITTNKEPIKDGAPLIYTNRKDGVQPGYDIRTDRFEVAVEAMDKVAKANLAKRQTPVVPMEPKGQNKSDGEPESSQGTDTKA